MMPLPIRTHTSLGFERERQGVLAVGQCRDTVKSFATGSRPDRWTISGFMRREACVAFKSLSCNLRMDHGRYLM